ncbi:MAG: gliding motility protein GldM [Bacteroidales bacterium]|nr:gliding motility protein GldM [Bacteroidales bacterium]MBK7626782.1 gliding motility protein GldM [Bacteroidales bacterium]
MAHEKLSPRQKMIGMMYLVLTAMLALNVSKEAVEAFKKVDKGLTQTIANYVLKNNMIYQEFDRAAAENPAKAGKYKTAAYAVKERADEAYTFIQGLKIEIINEAEGPENLAIVGDEVVIEAVKRIDQVDIPTQILIGDDNNGKANDLKAILSEYREFLITTLEGKNKSAEDALRSSLNTEDGKNKDGKIEKWENLNFQTLPLVAVICILSEMQLAVRNGETEVLNYLYSQIDASSFKFNKLSPIVIPNSNYVTQGGSYEAQVFISATDTTQKPEITINGGSKLEIDETGKGIYKVAASSIGTKKWGGVISLKAPDGSTKSYDFNSEYVVGEPNVIVSPTAMNVMYFGIPNPIDVSVPGISPDKISIRVVNGTFTTEKVKNSKGEPFKGAWAVKPSALDQKVQVIASANINGKVVQYPPYEFRVKRIPPPIAVFGGKNEGSISRATAAAQQGVFAQMPDFDFDLQYNITAFTILFSDSRGDFEQRSTSSTLTAQQKDLINRLTRGKYLTIKDITALGPDGKTVPLSPVILKID